ncbi:MAG: hypothetical protein ACR2KC_02155 [Acidimicrobiales bacterium]
MLVALSLANLHGVVAYVGAGFGAGAALLSAAAILLRLTFMGMQRLRRWGIIAL